MDIANGVAINVANSGTKSVAKSGVKSGVKSGAINVVEPNGLANVLALNVAVHWAENAANEVSVLKPDL